MARTNDKEWVQTITRYREQCKSILSISNSIRYVGVMNMYGRTLTGIIKPELKPLLKPDRAKDEFFLVSTFAALRRNTTGGIGALNHAVFHHSRVTILAIPQKEVTFYVTIDKNEKELEKIVSLIKQQTKRG